MNISSMNISNIWNDLKYLDNKYKKITSKYFIDKNGKYFIKDNILYIDYDNWGIEKIYIGEKKYNENKNFYTVLYKNNKIIYDIAVCIQIGNWTTFLKMESYLKNFEYINTNLYLVIIEDACIEKNIEYLKINYKNIVIIKTENRGMDIGLFLVGLHYMIENKINHEYLFKFHTKTDDKFRNSCLNSLIGSHNKIIDNIKALSKNNVGMVSGNSIYNYHQNKDYFNNNIYYLEMLSKYLYYQDLNYDNLVFSGGTFFIVKNKFFLEILNTKNIEFIYEKLNNNFTIDYNWYACFYNLNINNKKLILEHFNSDKNNRYVNNLNYQLKTNNSGLRDYMLEHAMERFFGYIIKQNNLDIIYTVS